MNGRRNVVVNTRQASMPDFPSDYYLEVVFHILVLSALLDELLESLGRDVCGGDSHVSLPRRCFVRGPFSGQKEADRQAGKT